jgi:hypothetical protein
MLPLDAICKTLLLKIILEDEGEILPGVQQGGMVFRVMKIRSNADPPRGTR